MLRERRRAANFKPNRRLDRKSSRGMIYENEELRLRTININAEVERGQSDIRKLRRENEQLRREIWTLRDEYDRLDKMLHQHKSHGDSHHHNNHNHHHQHQHGERNCCEDDEECDGEEGEEQENEDDEEEEQEDEDGECCSCNRSGGGEDRCVECDSGDDYCDDENCNCCGAEDSTCDNPKGATAPPATTTAEGGGGGGGGGASASTRHLNGGTTNGAKLREHLHVNFDHLSIVSEENLTGSDGSNSVQNLPADQDCLTVPPPGPAKDGKDSSAAAAAFLPHSPMSIMSLPATPCSPLLTDFQSLVPPLKHFENINYDDIKPLSHSSIASSASERPPSALVQSPSFVATASAASSPSFATARAPGRATDDVPSAAPSPEPPDSRPPPSPSPPGTPPLSSTSLSSLPIVLASSVSSSDWMWNNKTVSFSTFRPPTASVSQPSLLTSPHPNRKCDNSRPGQQQQPEEQGEIVAINPMMPKHFFSPLRPSRQMLLPSSPDLYVHDVLASPSGSSLSINEAQQTTRVVVEPIYSSIHKSRPSYPLSITCSPAVVCGAVDNPLYVSQTSPVASSGSFANPVPGAASADGVNVSRAPLRSPTVFQIGGNLEELLQDIEGAAEEVAQLEISGQEVDGFSRLVAPVSSATCSSELTPPPNVPEPMNLLPATLPYLDFKSNTAVITTPQAALANRSSAAAAAGAMNGNTTTTVTSVVSKPISSATAVRKKLFGKTNKEPVINEPGHDHRTPAVVPLKITIPGGEASAGAGAVDDKVATGQNSDKATSPVVRRRERRPEDEAETPSNQSSTAAVGKRKSRRIPLSFPGFGGSGKKGVQEDEKDTSSLENLASNQTPAAAAAGTPATTPSGKSGKPSLHRVSSGADISSISTSIGSPSTPVKGPCHHHRHSSQKGGRGKGRPGHSRTSSESQNIYASPNHGHHGCDLRRNSGMNDALTTSMSERNSNSLASSRESSTSLSMRSHKSRRISENSHSGGKIPWCGCWGNGCL